MWYAVVCKRTYLLYTNQYLFHFDKYNFEFWVFAAIAFANDSLLRHCDLDHSSTLLQEWAYRYTWQ